MSECVCAVKVKFLLLSLTHVYTLSLSLSLSHALVRIHAQLLLQSSHHLLLLLTHVLGSPSSNKMILQSFSLSMSLLIPVPLQYGLWTEVTSQPLESLYIITSPFF